jgi:hypothetical protein
MEELRDHVLRINNRSENTRSEYRFKCKSFCVGARKLDGEKHDLVVETRQKVAVVTSPRQKLYEFSINIVLEIYFARKCATIYGRQTEIPGNVIIRVGRKCLIRLCHCCVHEHGHFGATLSSHVEHFAEHHLSVLSCGPFVDIHSMELFAIGDQCSHGHFSSTGATKG